MFRTLRSKLIASSVLLVLLVCGGIGLTTTLYLDSYLIGQVDTRLTESLSRMMSPGGPPGVSGGNQGNSGRFGSGFDDDADVCEAQGTGLAGHPRPGFVDSLSAAVLNGQISYAGVFTDPTVCEPLSDAARQELLTVVDRLRPSTVDLDGVGQYRVLARTDSAGATIITGVSLERESRTLNRLAWTLAIVIGAAILFATVVLFLLVRSALRPLDRVAATARKVSTMPLHRGEVELGIRVPEEDTDPRTEVGQVGAALNQMLGHVSTALDRRHQSEMQVRQFVADASHELRTPLAAIRGYTELAQRPNTDPQSLGHALSRVESESKRMSALVDDLLLLARLDAGRDLERQEVDLTLLVMDVVSDARAAGPDHRWRLDLPDEPISIIGDQFRLHQVLANLLTNARFHTPPGTTVTAGLRLSTGECEVTITDDGPGIDPALLPDIFDRFVRGDSARSRGMGSTGLGLSIVQAVVRAHGGSVSVESRPGQTTFRVTLPAEVQVESQPVPV
jgi:two-component system OmpR family sensor kinase